MSGRGQSPVLAASLVLALVTGGCGFFSRPERRYVSQEEVLKAVAKATRYSPHSSSYCLVHATVARDLLTFHYQGVKNPGDRAWVIRFAQKNTEQRPEELVKLDRLLQAIGEGKEGFEVLSRAERELNGLKVEFASYRYRSLLRDQSGQPVAAGGAAAVTRVESNPAPVIYHMSVDNMEGDRPHLGWGELLPLLSAIKS